MKALLLRIKSKGVKTTFVSVVLFVFCLLLFLASKSATISKLLFVGLFGFGVSLGYLFACLEIVRPGPSSLLKDAQSWFGQNRRAAANVAILLVVGTGWLIYLIVRILDRK